MTSYNILYTIWVLILYTIVVLYDTDNVHLDILVISILYKVIK